MLDERLKYLTYPQLPKMISLYKEGDWYWVGGITFREFLMGVNRPLCLALLNHQFTAAETEYRHTRIDYVQDDWMNVLADNCIHYGDFWWIDICSPEALTQLPQAEFLELLYLKQLGSALTSPHFPTLKNRYAYCGHDDGWALRLWVDSPELLAHIVAPVLSLKYAAFSGRRSHPEPNRSIAGALVARATEGILIDFSQVDAHTDTVPIYRVGIIKNCDYPREIANQAEHERLEVVNDQWIYATN